MKKTYLMLLLTLAGLGSSCTNEDGTEDVTPSGDPGEIQLVFSGSGEEEEYTKAIASDSENKISKLDVYLFGAASASTNTVYIAAFRFVVDSFYQAGRTERTSVSDIGLCG